MVTAVQVLKCSTAVDLLCERSAREQKVHIYYKLVSENMTPSFGMYMYQLSPVLFHWSLSRNYFEEALAMIYGASSSSSLFSFTVDACQVLFGNIFVPFLSERV